TKTKSKRNLIKYYAKIFDVGINYSSDTSVTSKSIAAYDRFIFEINHKSRIEKGVILKFDKDWRDNRDPDLPKKAAKHISDHYPIEFDLRLI
ncbi:11428_t:CDS:1, partial [Racocetra persica]